MPRLAHLPAKPGDWRVGHESVCVAHILLCNVAAAEIVLYVTRASPCITDGRLQVDVRRVRHGRIQAVQVPVSSAIITLEHLSSTTRVLSAVCAHDGLAVVIDKLLVIRPLVAIATVFRPRSLSEHCHAARTRRTYNGSFLTSSKNEPSERAATFSKKFWMSEGRANARVFVDSSDLKSGPKGNSEKSSVDPRNARHS